MLCKAVHMLVSAFHHTQVCRSVSALHACNERKRISRSMFSRPCHVLALCFQPVLSSISPSETSLTAEPAVGLLRVRLSKIHTTHVNQTFLQASAGVGMCRPLFVESESPFLDIKNGVNVSVRAALSAGD